MCWRAACFESSPIVKPTTRKPRDSKQAERSNKHGKEASARNEKQSEKHKDTRASEKHRKMARDEPRYERAGSPESRRRDTRFTDVWNDNPRR